MSALRRWKLSCVPAAPATLVTLELLLQQPVVELKAVSELVLSDLGATLQILRCRRECDQDDQTWLGIPARVVALGRDAILKVIPSFSDFGPDFPAAAAFKLWEHSRRVAEAAQTIASSFPEVDAEKARIAGLLHEMGSLPQLLGARELPYGMREEAVPEHLIKEWSLPSWITGALVPHAGCTATTARLTRIVALAHELVRLEHHHHSA